MSGGYFNGSEYWFEEIENGIVDLIKSNNDDNWYDQKTIEQFSIGAKMAAIARVYAMRIDYLVSGDDGEDTFHKRLAEELKEVEDRYAGKI